MTLDEFRKDVERRISENNLIKSQIAGEESSIREQTRRLGCVKDALKIIEGIALERRNGIKSGIENVVSETLKAIYGEEYSFEMTYTEKNNRSCLEMRVARKTEEGVVKRQMDGFGGGVSDSVSVPLRMMVLKGSETGDILWLDEVFKHVGEDQVELVGNFLKTIADKLGIQIFLVTHHDRLVQYADKGFTIVNDGGAVKV